MSDLKSVVKVVPQPKNHVHENITSVKNFKAPERPPIVQDSCDGHRQDIERAGLKLQYVFKKVSLTYDLFHFYSISSSNV